MFTDLFSASMTALLTSQLDRTRQPGLAQADASWCAPVGVASDEGIASKLLESTIDMNGRYSRPRTIPGAAARLGRRTP